MFLGNKKGLQHGVIVTLLVVLASAVVLFGIYFYFWGAVSDIEKDLACEKAIQLAATTKNLPSFKEAIGKGQPYFAIGGPCQRKKIVLKHDSLVSNGLLNQDAAHQLLADEVYKCWKKVGAGKIDPFSNWGNDGESYCLICGVVEFDAKLRKFLDTKKKENGIGITSPIYYLMTHEVPDPKMKGKSYWEFLYNKKPELTQIDLEKINQNKQFVEEGLAIVVSMYKPDAKSLNWNKAGQYGGLGAVVVGAGVISVLATGGIALLPIIGGGALAGSILAGGALLTGGGYIAYKSFTSAFSECPTCQGIGALSLLNVDEAFTKGIEITVNGQTETVKLCTRPVN